MAKQKRSADGVAETNTKKLQKITKGKAGGVKRKGNSENREKEDDVSEEVVRRKVKPKSHRSKPVGKTVQRTSKYFQDQEEPVTTSQDNGIPAPFMEGTETLMKVENEKEEESDDEEWEDVEELIEPPCAKVEPVLPSQPVEIEIETPDHTRKRQRREKREAEFETYLRRMMNRFNKDVLVDTHKVHLLCLVANGIFRNRLCSEPDLLAIGLSVVPVHFTMVTPDQADVSFLCGLLKWFQATFTLTPDLPQDQEDSPRAVLERRFETLSARNHEEMTHVFLVILRSLQLFCRLVLSLHPIPLKQVSAKNKAKTSSSPAKKSPSQPQLSPGVKRPGESSGGGAGPGGKRQRRSAAEKEKPVAGGRPKNSQRRSVASKVSYKENSSEGEGSSEGEEFLVSSEEASEDEEERAPTRQGRNGRGKGVAPQRQRSKKEASSEGEEEDEGEEVGRSRRRKGRGVDEWLEVYLERVGRWMCLDVQQTGVGQHQQCARHATQPLSYVLGVDGDGYLKDLSSRYDPTWMTSSRKRRVEAEWWEETLCGFRCPASQRERQEDKELQAKLLDKPLPTVVSEFKNHPLYALKRHLLKYEAIYPPTAAILGYCRGEAVYSRDCVHTLHSKDTWLKEARTVLLGEEPYKCEKYRMEYHPETELNELAWFQLYSGKGLPMVKGSSNRARKARQGAEQKDKDDLPLFGDWQTDEYQPPIAVDGKVPRNDYGNVYLFRPCMLPVGCIHMHLPSLHRVARKLDIDCASAVTGFDFHCGFSHPVTEGYIVCEEYQEVLQAAWENEQDIIQKKEREKREKRALDNWTLLVKSLLIRERLQRRYGRQRPDQSLAKEGQRGLSSGEEENEGADTTAVTLANSWPQNRQEDQEREAKTTPKREKRGQQKNLFPFEKM